MAYVWRKARRQLANKKYKETNQLTEACKELMKGLFIIKFSNEEYNRASAHLKKWHGKKLKVILLINFYRAYNINISMILASLLTTNTSR